MKLGNLTDRFKITAKIDEARLKFEAGIDKQMSTDPDLCMVCCAVCTQFEADKNPVFTCVSAANESEEFVLISKVWECIRCAYQNQIPLVGFNTMTFDLPVLIRRAMLADISVGPGMIHNLMKRQEQNHLHQDLMQLLGLRSPFSGKIEAKGLNYYLRLFGLGGKFNGIDGSCVYPLWKEGQHEEIRAYCQQDVEKTAALFRRVSPWLMVPKETSNFNEQKEKANE
ncbi:MAG: hypothetical protein ACLQBD_11460 [Syntrophobacteraceae bacterium]